MQPLTAHVDFDTYNDLCTHVAKLVCQTGLYVTFGIHEGELHTSWDGSMRSDDRLWTVYVANALTRSGNEARFGLHRTVHLDDLIASLTIERLRNIVRHAVPTEVYTNGVLFVTYNESVQLLDKLTNNNKENP